MRISIITDEISSDLETAIELGTKWGVHDFELRGFLTDRVPSFSVYQKRVLQDSLQEYQARIIAIGPGLFKGVFNPIQPARQYLGWMDKAVLDKWQQGKDQVDMHLNELLPASLDFANEFGINLIIIFGFDRAGLPPNDPPEELLNCLRKAAEKALAAGIQLALENEDGFWADSGERTAHIIKLVNHPALGINWDPGNAFFAGDEPFPKGYQSVRSLVRHVHFKDARIDQAGQYHYTVNGQVDWNRQLAALMKDGYDGWISVETHAHPKVAMAKAALQRLQSFLADKEMIKSSIDKEIQEHESL